MQKSILILACFLVLAQCQEMLITKEKISRLRKHVPWTVVDYEQSPFRGWTVDEAVRSLGSAIGTFSASKNDFDLPAFRVEDSSPLPRKLNWLSKSADCIHAPRAEGKDCTSCWAFSVAGMVADRCCMAKADFGWLSPQELVSCDARNYGCAGGWAYQTMGYLTQNKGLVPESCFPYVGYTMPCNKKCRDGKEWTSSHVCECKNPKHCYGKDAVMQCLATGPVALTMEVCESFYYYAKGTYACDCKSHTLGLQTVTAVGYGTDPECYFLARNSWGEKWGALGYFNVSCTSCGIDGTYQYGNVMCSVSS